MKVQKQGRQCPNWKRTGVHARCVRFPAETNGVMRVTGTNVFLITFLGFVEQLIQDVLDGVHRVFLIKFGRDGFQAQVLQIDL